jgi:hypothetical protein
MGVCIFAGSGRADAGIKHIHKMDVKAQCAAKADAQKPDRASAPRRDQAVQRRGIIFLSHRVFEEPALTVARMRNTGVAGVRITA